MREIRNQKSRIIDRGRAALLWGLSGFAILQLGLAVGIELWLPQIRDPEYGERVVRLYQRTVTASPRPYTIVMLGSSRTLFGFQASQLEDHLIRSLHRPVVVFNFGINGGGPLMELLDLRRLLHQGIQPDLLLLEVLPPLLAGQVSHELPRLPVSRVWLRELRFLERFGGSRDKMRSDWLWAWPVPWYAHRFALVSHFLPAWLPHQVRLDWLYHMDDSGCIPGIADSRSPEAHRVGVENALREFAGYFMNFRLEGDSCRALRELLDLCRDRRIHTALVLMPEGTEFRGLYPLEVWPQIDSLLARLSREYQVPIINAREWVADEDFSDSHHLFARGAAVFTERLCHCLYSSSALDNRRSALLESKQWHGPE